MRIFVLIVTFFFSLQAGHAQESGIRFYHGTWDEAVALAKKEKKKIFVDFFTEWCGPCLNMALTVFPLPQVGEVYNKHFVCLKIDAEKGEGKELAKKYGVHSYPSYIFVDPKTGEMVHRSGGNKPAADFIADVQGALNPKLSSIYLTEKYKSGKYDDQFLMDYIRGQKVSGNRNLQKDFDRLISMGHSLREREIWDLYCECIGGYDNPYVKEISDHYADFVGLYGKAAVDAQLVKVTAYAPESFIGGLCNFEGKSHNMKMARMASFFREEKTDEAWAYVDTLIADTTVDKPDFVKRLSFYTRVNPRYRDDELSFDRLADKVKYMRYVAYNLYDRDDAYTHYNYALALEYLIRRAREEGKEIPAFIYETPRFGKDAYDMRHPLLKPKPMRKK